MTRRLRWRKKERENLGELPVPQTGLTWVRFFGEATWEGVGGGRARRATIKALPATLHRPRPYGLASTFPTNLPMRSSAPCTLDFAVALVREGRNLARFRLSGYD